jgi:carboxylate-amine ligase
MPPALADRAAFNALVRDLQAIGAIEDASYLYWYARPSGRFPTVEFRAGDVCLSVDEAVALAGLVRGLAWTAATEVQAGRSWNGEAPATLEAAMWRASRYGLDASLVSPSAWAQRPAAAVVAEFLDHVGTGLEVHGDADEVGDLVAAILARGNGAARQREAFASRHSGRDVVDRVLEETAPLSRRSLR